MFQRSDKISANQITNALQDICVTVKSNDEKKRIWKNDAESKDILSNSFNWVGSLSMSMAVGP